MVAIFLAVTLMFLAVIILKTDTSYYELMALIYTMYQVCLFTLVSQWYLITYVKKLLFMAKKHSYEFMHHAKKEIPQLIITYLAMWTINIGTV